MVGIGIEELLIGRESVNWGGLKTEFVSEGPEPRAYKNFFDFLSRIYPPHTCIDNHHHDPPKTENVFIIFLLA